MWNMPVLLLGLLGRTSSQGNDNCDNECKLLQYEKALPNALAVYEYQNTIVPPTFPTGPVDSNFIAPKSRFSNAKNAACRVAKLIKPNKSVPSCEELYEIGISKRGPDDTDDMDENPIRELNLPVLRKGDMLTMCSAMRDILRKINMSEEEKNQEYEQMESLLGDVIAVTLVSKQKKRKTEPEILANALNSMCGNLCVGSL
ncbi:uncharacterized protein LOC117585115 [Drosophila guanche]|uniref:uncharacterized protein LOC117585115 n=1 Tax=Drosophila guanche TaxID=7266 RepID=UPI001470E5FE|nr:uncharacterized protein LOC117585115 [Drosophila guanche]